MTLIPHREDLERRLGPIHTLDGSFGSLWAIEQILLALRRVPQHTEQVAWIASYMCDLFERAFGEMGMTFTRPTATTLHVTAPITYQLDAAYDLERLISPPNHMPTFHGIKWLGNAMLGTACTPWYGLSTIFQNNSWARTDHDMIGNQRDRMDRAVPWLTEEFARMASVPGEHLELAQGLARHMAWPPLGYAQNDLGGHNLPRLRALIDQADALASRTVLDGFVASQDRACQMLAAATAIDVGIPPDTRHEAQVYREAIHHFHQSRPSPFITTSIDRLLCALETPNVDASHPEYASAMDAPAEQGLAVARRVLASEPKLPTFHCCAGWHEEQLGNKEAALARYDRAIELKPDYAQALLNRGALQSMMGEHERASEDFFAARELQPENKHIPMNLLVNFFMNHADSPARSAQPVPVHDERAAAQTRGAALRGLLVRHGQKEVDLNATMRALITHKDYMVPSIYLPHDVVHADGVKFSDAQHFPGGELWVFTDREAADRAQAEQGTLGLYSAGQHAQAVITAFASQPFSRLRINPVGPEEEGFIFLPQAQRLLGLWSSGVALEEVAERGDIANLREEFMGSDTLLIALKQKQLVITQSPLGPAAHIAATIDRSELMTQVFGDGVTAAPAPPASCVQAMQASGIAHFYLAGVGQLFPLSILL